MCTHAYREALTRAAIAGPHPVEHQDSQLTAAAAGLPADMLDRAGQLGPAGVTLSPPAAGEPAPPRTPAPGR